MGLEVVYQKPRLRLSKNNPEHKIYPYLLSNLDILGTFFWHYNNERPHQSLDDRTPCEVYNFQGAEVQVST